jgi:hypothetical protein
MTRPSRDAIGKVVAVHWLDIFEKTVNRHDEILPARCVSYGLLESIDDDRFTIITEKSDDDWNKLVFPVGCVTEVIVL